MLREQKANTVTSLNMLRSIMLAWIEMWFSLQSKEREIKQSNWRHFHWPWGLSQLMRNKEQYKHDKPVGVQNLGLWGKKGVFWAGRRCDCGRYWQLSVCGVVQVSMVHPRECSWKKLLKKKRQIEKVQCQRGRAWRHWNYKNYMGNFYGSAIDSTAKMFNKSLNRDLGR